MGSERRLWLPVTVGALLIAHAVLVGWAIRDNFLIVDEPGAIASGFAHLHTGTYYAYRVNPPLPRTLAAAVAWAAGADFDPGPLRDAPWYRCELPLGRAFIAANGDRALPVVAAARLTGIAWSVLGGLAIFLWGRELFGDRGGLIGLALWCFNPTVIALAAVVGPDLPAGVMAVIATHVFWGYLRQPSWWGAGRAGLLLGVAELTKFTLLVLYPVWLVLWLVAKWSALPERRPLFRTRLGVAHGVLITSLSVLVINLGYEFRGSGTRLGRFEFVSRALTGGVLDAYRACGNRFQRTTLGELPVLLPADYLRGIDTQWKDMEVGRPSYLRGEWRTDGWWYYYLYALAVKLPLGTTALIILGAAATAVRVGRPGSIAGLAPVWLPAAGVLVLVSSHTEFNHHMRYVFPALPFLFVGAGACAALTRRSCWAGVVVVGLLLWTAASSVLAGPHFLAYFNESVGGPENGHEHLIDSNIDWGQDLLRLKAWTDSHHPPDSPLYLAYFGPVDPATVGIRYLFPPPDPRPGRFAISIHYVRGGSFPSFDGRGGLIAVPPDRFAYFQYIRPVAKAGYSIILYEVTPEEANAARNRLGLPLLPVPLPGSSDR